jgi:alpha-L-fucosidase
MGEKYSRQLVDLVKKYQPQALINSRIGNGMGDYATYGDNEVPRISPAGVWEAVDTTNDSWGYSLTDINWKSPQELAHRLISTAARGGTYMINMGPKADGTFPEIPRAALLDLGDWLTRHGQTIYGARPSPWSVAQPWGDVTTGSDGLYLHVFDWPVGGSHSISLYGLQGKVRRALLLDGGMELTVTVDGNWTRITLPDGRPDSLVPVVSLDMDGEYGVKDSDVITAEQPSFLIAERATCTGCKLAAVGWMERFGEWKTANSLTDWHSDGKASWTAQVERAGLYKLAIDLSAGGDADFSEWEIAAGDRRYTVEAHYTGERAVTSRTGRRAFWGVLDPRFRQQAVGAIMLDAGVQSLSIRPLTTDGSATSVKVSALRLTPMPINNAAK